MSERLSRSPMDSEHQVLRNQQTFFQEVPGEAEADAVRDAFLQNAGSTPASVAAALSGADAATKARVVSRLQQERGNAYVQRVMAETRGMPGRLVGQSQSDMVAEVLQRKGSGSPLPDGTRERMETHFGADLSGVRVHTDAEAAGLNRELNAQAFTVGSDIFLAEGKYDPASPAGQGLLAHELAHVGQQGGFGAQSVQREAAPEEEEMVQRQPQEEEEEPPAG